MNQIVIKPGRERSLLRRHPWIFSGAIATIQGEPGLGEPAMVVSSTGEFLARAAFNPNSKIAGRVWTWEPEEDVTPELLESRIKQAVALRRQLSTMIQSDAMRLVHAESDGIPGLILDQYGEVIVVQFLTAGVEYWRETVLEIIKSVTGGKTVYERSDVDVRKLEGLPLKKGLLYGQDITGPIMIDEKGLKYQVDVVDGHKTGTYLDQRNNRLLARTIAEGKKVLDCFSYTGGFSINSLAGHARSVSMVDSSRLALDRARENIELNNLSLENVTYIDQDVFKYLRILRDKGESYDLIILDPPKFAPTISQAERATRGYKDINLLALKLLNPGGYLMTFSCSGGVSEELFQKIIAGAALEACVEAKILMRLYQSVDHPVALNFPEGAYLKGFLIQKQGNL
jgi:23S rRNA (cytosine1962-C5)-methyltransferase